MGAGLERRPRPVRTRLWGAPGTGLVHLQASRPGQQSPPPCGETKLSGLTDTPPPRPWAPPSAQSQQLEKAALGKGGHMSPAASGGAGMLLTTPHFPVSACDAPGGSPVVVFGGWQERHRGQRSRG